MVSSLRLTACVVASFALTGCAANELIIKRQAEVEAKVEYLIQNDKKNLRQISDQAGQIQLLDEQTKLDNRQLKQAQDSILELRFAQDEIKARMTLMIQQVSTPKVAVVNQEEASKTKDSGPPVDYVKSFGLYSANNFRAAIEAFESFLRTSPHSDYAANAQYWIGECHYTLSDLSKALVAFQKVVENYPKSAKAPDALLKQGYTLAAMKQKDKAAVLFETLIKTYPSSPAAAKARERLTAN